MNAEVHRILIVNAAIVTVSVTCCLGRVAQAQSGGINQPGSGQKADAFTMRTLRCTIKSYVPGGVSPEKAGARWRPKGTQAWCTSDEKALLPPGTYTIEFKGKLADWIAPADKTVVLDRDKSETGTYRRREPEAPKPPKEPTKPAKKENQPES